MDLKAELKRRVVIAIPKKGRLYEKIVQLLEQIDLEYRRNPRLDVALSTNMDVAIAFLPAHDIALYVGEGRVDMGITGEDIIAETGAKVDKLLDLGFGKCKLCVQAPVEDHLESAQALAGKRIVTSFPNLAKKYFEELAPGSDTHVHYVSGSVEAACSLGLADGIVDLVESGDTMRAAGLEKVAEIMTTQAVVISNPHTPVEFKSTIDLLTRRIEGVITAQQTICMEYHVKRDALAAASKLTPGFKAPTISPLMDDELVAVKVMVPKNSVNEIMDSLIALGASDIIAYKLVNSRHFERN